MTMPLADMSASIRLGDYPNYVITLKAYASALGYALKSNNDYGDSQVLAVVGGAYCIVTSTEQGLFAQPDVSVVIPCDVKTICELKTL